MLRAVWNGVVLAEAPRTVRIEGNHYFPPESLKHEYFLRSATKTLCPWKGIAQYYNVAAGEDVDPDGAWCYHHPSPLAYKIKNHMAFGVEVRIEGERERRNAEDSRGHWWHTVTGRRTGSASA